MIYRVRYRDGQTLDIDAPNAKRMEAALERGKAMGQVKSWKKLKERIKRENMAGYQRFSTSYGVYKVKQIGDTWWVLTPDGSRFPYGSRAAALDSFAGYKKKAKNPPKRRMTKLQRLQNAARKSKQRRLASGIRSAVEGVFGKGKASGAKVTRNPGGSFTIKPIRRRR